MNGGLAVRGNLLVVTWSAGRGHVLLFDVEAGERVAAWTIPAGESGYSDAAGVAIGDGFRLFVTDAHNNRVRRFNAFGKHLGDIGKSPPPDGDRGRDRAGVLDHPHAVACRRSCLYVAMGERPRQRGVQRFHPDGHALKPLPSRGDPAESFFAPQGLWADDAGLLVADTLRGRVQVFDQRDAFVHEVTVPTEHGVARPHSLVRLHRSELLVVDRGDAPRLRAVAVDGRQLATADDLMAQCEDVIAVSKDQNGWVYLLDRGGERVVRADVELRFDRVVVDLAESTPDWDDESPAP